MTERRIGALTAAAIHSLFSTDLPPNFHPGAIRVLTVDTHLAAG
jgi:hypothetical protein